MQENKHQPNYIPQIGIPEKIEFQERTYTRAIYHKATAPGFFGVIILCFFMSFINIKCSGRVIATYSGIEIITGADKSSNDKTKNEGDGFITAKISAYYRLSISSSYAEIHSDTTNISTMSPPFDDVEYSDDLEGMKEASLNDKTTNSYSTRLFTGLALLTAVIGLMLTLILKNKWNSISQILLGILGFIFLVFLQFYVKVTLPASVKTENALDNNYELPIITTEFAIGYWLCLLLFLCVGVLGIIRHRMRLKQEHINKVS